MLVEGETDGLDGDVGAAGLLEEGSRVVTLASCIFGVQGTRGGLPQNARRDVASTANGDHEVGLELIEDLLGRLLTELVDLFGENLLVWYSRSGFIERCAVTGYQSGWSQT